MAKNVGVDVPNIWTYLAQVISLVLIESGLPMTEFFWEISKLLMPVGKPGLLVTVLIRIRAERLTAEMVGAMWTGNPTEMQKRTWT